MSSKKSATPIDTSAGQQAHALAVQYQAQIEPRVPTGTIPELAADLTTLGVTPPGPPPAQPPATPPPPSLADALAALVNLVSATHDALLGAQASSSVRKSYGLGRKAPSKEANAVLDVAGMIIHEATANPADALALGILPTDVTALTKAVADLTSAEAAAHAHNASAGITAKQKHAAEVRMHEATHRIGGAGVLAFAQNAAVRAEFAALLPKKKP